MSGGAVAERSSKAKGKGGRRPKRRIDVRVDMTPMVDIVMLLLIFYMVTTVFSMPQAMEINLPKDRDDVEVAESKLLTLRVDNENRFYWNVGDPAKHLPKLLPSITPPGDTAGYKLDSDSLRMLLKNLNFDIPKLNTLILINKKAKYASMVDILDEIDLLERSWNAALAQKANKKVGELTKDEKFSYRYAMGEWEDRDDRIIAAAISDAAGGGE